MSQQNARQRKIFLSELQSRRINVRSVGWMSPTEGVCHQRTVFISAAYTVAPPKKNEDWTLIISATDILCQFYISCFPCPFCPHPFETSRGNPVPIEKYGQPFPFPPFHTPFQRAGGSLIASSCLSYTPATETEGKKVTGPSGHKQASMALTSLPQALLWLRTSLLDPGECPLCNTVQGAPCPSTAPCGISSSPQSSKSLLDEAF